MIYLFWGEKKKVLFHSLKRPRNDANPVVYTEDSLYFFPLKETRNSRETVRRKFLVKPKSKEIIKDD